MHSRRVAGHRGQPRAGGFEDLHVITGEEREPLRIDLDEPFALSGKPLPGREQLKVLRTMRAAFERMDRELLGNIYVARCAASLLAAMERTQSELEHGLKSGKRASAELASKGSRRSPHKKNAPEPDQDDAPLALPNVPESFYRLAPRCFNRHNMRQSVPQIRELLPHIDKVLGNWEGAWKRAHNRQLSLQSRTTANETATELTLVAYELFCHTDNLNFMREYLYTELRQVASELSNRNQDPTEHDSVQKLYRALQETPESLSQRMEKVSQARDEALQCRDLLVTTNQPLVFRVAREALLARPHLAHNVEIKDLVNEGNLGLMEAIQGFDASRGTLLSTYAVWWIRQSIVRALDSVGMIRVPSYLQHPEGATPTKDPSSVASETPDEPRDNEKFQKASYRVAIVQSLDHAPNSPNFESETPLSAAIRDMYEDGERSASELSELREELFSLMNRAGLTPKERMIIMSRYGLTLDKREGESLTSLGKVLKITKERVRQIEAKAFEKMRNVAYGEKNRGVEPFIDE